MASPPMARAALDRYLIERGLPVAPARWKPQTPLIAGLEFDATAGITGARLWAIMRRSFWGAAKAIQRDRSPLAEKLRQAGPHWMRHTHALASGAELTTVQDNLRHAAISTTSIYLHSDEVKRARQLSEEFSARW